jgi:hypothetical protein
MKSVKKKEKTPKRKMTLPTASSRFLPYTPLLK